MDIVVFVSNNCSIPAISFLTRGLGYPYAYINQVAVGVVSLITTVVFDSIFWGRLLYPEGEVLYFNTVLNKSKEWGVMPFWWYFYSAIPKAMSGSLALCVAGIALDSRVRKSSFAHERW